MSNSIESRFDKDNSPVLKGLGYLDPSRIANPETWENISLAVKWLQSDLDADALESEVFPLRRHRCLPTFLKKRNLRKEKPVLTTCSKRYKVNQNAMEASQN